MNIKAKSTASSLAAGTTGSDLTLSGKLTANKLYLTGQSNDVASTLNTLKTYTSVNHPASSLVSGATGGDLTLSGVLTLGTQNVASTLSTLSAYTGISHSASGLDSGATGTDLTLSGTLSTDSITATTSLTTPKVIISSNNSNTSYGYLAGNVVTGNKNTLIGCKAGNVMTTGANNTCIGSSAAPITISSQNCTIIGTQAGNLLTAGSNNVLVGYNTGAVLAGASNQGNTIIGTGAGSATTGISYCTYLGNGVTGTNSASNETALGNGATGSGSSTVTIGNTAVTNTYLKGTVNCSSIACTGSISAAASLTLSSAYTANGSTATVKNIPSTVGNQFYLCDAGNVTFVLPQTAITGTVVVFRRIYASGSATMDITSYDGTTATLLPSGVASPAVATISMSPASGITSASFVHNASTSKWYQF